MLIKKLIPFFALAIFIFSSCGSDSDSDSRNADINKEWTLIDMNYTGVNTIEGESVAFDGQLVGGNVSMQFVEDPNTVRSMGMYTIQLESTQEDYLRLMRQEVTFDQFGSWTRDGNVISTSAENSFDTDLIIANLSADKLDLNFDYSVTVDFFGVPSMSNVKGTYFLASPEYIDGWKDAIKGGWELSDIEKVHYDGSFTEIDGLIDKISIGKYAGGTAPLHFGANGSFLASGFYLVDVDATEFDPFGPKVETSFSETNTFLKDGSYSIDGRTLTVVNTSGETRMFSIIDVTSDELILHETLAGEPFGPFDQVNSRSRIKYTLIRKDYEAAPTSTFLGDWKLIDYNLELVTELTEDGVTTSYDSEAELISSDSKMTITKNPNEISFSGTHEVKNTNNFGSFNDTEMLFTAYNWIEGTNTIQIFNTTFEGDSYVFTIDKLDETEFMITHDIDFTVSQDGVTIRQVGYRNFTFER